jgi:hypothetical protein
MRTSLARSRMNLSLGENGLPIYGKRLANGEPSRSPFS